MLAVRLSHYPFLLLGAVILTGTGFIEEGSVQEEYAQGIELFQKGQLDLAEQKFSAVIKAAPRSPEPHFFLGKISAAKNQLEKAEEMFEEAIRLKPDFADAYQSLGVVYLAQNKNEKAEEAFLETIRLKPDLALAHLNLADAYLGLNRAGEAVKEFQRALELAPQDKDLAFGANFNLGSLYYRGRDYPSALTYLENARALNPKHSQVLLSLCDVYFKLRRAEDGAAVLQELSQLAVESPGLHLGLGLLLTENERYAEAALHFEQARKFLPPTFELLQGMGTTHYYLGDYSDAQKDLSQALELKPSPQSYFILGKVYLAQNDPRAIEAFRNCVNLDPGRDDAWEELSRELAKRKAFDQAIEAFQRYVEIFPQKPFAHLLLGEAYYNKSTYSKAVQQFQNALELNPQLARTYYSLGEVYKTVGRTEEARTNFQHALQLNPQSALTNYNLGDVLIAERNYRQAVLFLTQAIKLNPDDAEFYFKLGQAYFLEKKYFEANAQLKKAAQLRPDYAQAHYLLGRCYTAQGKPELARTEYMISRNLGTGKSKTARMATR